MLSLGSWVGTLCVRSPQNTTWLNKNTMMDTMLQFAPTKGESQIAFHKDANELFTLGDTNSDAKTASKKKGKRCSVVYTWRERK
jgi:hypothetical protein